MSRYSKTTLRKGGAKMREETAAAPSPLRSKTTGRQEEAILLDDLTPCPKKSLPGNSEPGVAGPSAA